MLKMWWTKSERFLHSSLELSSDVAVTSDKLPAAISVVRIRGNVLSLILSVVQVILKTLNAHIYNSIYFYINLYMYNPVSHK